MCGIVGYLGHKNSVHIIVEGLRRLEYRGYDSAGISIINDKGELDIIKRAGKLDVLKGVLEKLSPQSPIGIGHTRWATHGEVSDRNAHPHENEHIAIVHNGIIENAKDLKSELEAQDLSFHSETDSEVFLVLVTQYFTNGLSLQKAVSQAFQKIKGNSAFVVMSKNADEIVAVKRAAPLVCGSRPNENEAFFSSDPYALVGHTEKVYFPEDDIVCVAKQEDQKVDLSFFDLEGNPSEHYLVQEQRGQVELSEKGEFDHFMLKEIFEQPGLIRKFLEYYHGEGAEKLEQICSDFSKAPKIHISGCGTAWHAGLYLRNIFESQNQIPTLVELASEFRYRGPLIDKEEIALFISQSGETADTLACEILCRQEGLKTFSIVNVEGSTLFRNCHGNLLLHAGVEVGVCSTKAYTLMVLAGFLISKRMQKIEAQKVADQLSLLSNRIDGLLNDTSNIQNIAKEIYKLKGFLFTGRGIYYPVVLEGALKLKEIAYVHAEGYAAGELKHGPIALIDDEMVNIAVVGPELYDKTVSNVEEVKARGGVMVLIGPKDDAHLKTLADYYIPLDYSGLAELGPLLVNVVNQLLSYYMAKFKGTDIDRPRNLAKSVTVE